jgi:hypothetical protein
MNSLDSEFIENHQLKPYVKEVRTIPVFSLASVLEKHVKRSDRLDFFDIDVEGHDLEVLKTNDWSKFRPKIVVVESDTPLEQDLNTSISTYLKEVDYRLIGKSIINNNLGNLFYLDTTL